MLNESRQNISTKESLLFCILGGFFIYGVCSIPCLQLYLFPPKNDGGITFTMVCLQPPDKYSFIISFIIFTAVGIWLLKKADFQNRVAYFSLLALTIAIGGGFLTGVLETVYHIFISDNSNQEPYIISLDKYYGFAPSIVWVIAFSLIQIPFTSLFLLTTSLISKFKTYNSLK
ncbi:MAG: hypothetical protein AAB336_01040 [Acidobacteriota bacterium]